WADGLVDGVTLRAAADRAALAAQLRDAGEFAGVLSLLALGDEPLAATVTAVQALGDAGLEAPLWCLTRGAVATGRSDRPADPRQAAVWGLGRSAALELPTRWGGLIDLPEQLDDAALRRLAAALARTDGEDQLAVRASGTFARRLVRHPLGHLPAHSPGERPAAR
ncbi:hypothetical protein, partial [Streptomyces sp. CBMA123]|uniref:hypothetical protein n=1 Tax=Streptomyces sp. CBMA123 TaxID=1896313 RepID=UPI001661B877